LPKAVDTKKLNAEERLPVGKTVKDLRDINRGLAKPNRGNRVTERYEEYC
jgi:hypothetical protein